MRDRRTLAAMRLQVSVVAAVVGGACGDNTLPAGEPLSPAAHLTIVAHPDDDLLFMQPDLQDALNRGGGMTTVYVTAGNDDRGLDYVEGRYAGLMAAYGAIAGTHDWSCGWIDLADHAAEHCRLDEAGISLVFLGYPDGGLMGERPNSLRNLWQGTIASATTISRRTATYDRADLIAVLSEIVTTTAPAALRTLEIAATHGHDHSDHMVVGALAVLATAATPARPELISYRGYNIEREPANADPVLFDRARDIMARYHSCTNHCAPCGQPCAVQHISPAELGWLQRRYAVGMRRRDEGQLRQGDGCVTAPRAGDSPAIADCAAAPSWQLDESGALRSSEAGGGVGTLPAVPAGRGAMPPVGSSDALCLTVDSTGEITAQTCGALGAGGRFFLDDEGHLWSGVVPLPRPTLEHAGLYCVGQAGGRLRASLCGAGFAPSWELARPTTATPRTTATITRTGRAVRIARFPDEAGPRVCAVETGARGLMCAPGDPGGSLLRANRMDSPDAPLAIEPESLVLGDIDGDGRTDACGRDPGGLVCATAAGRYRAERWAAALPSAGPANPTDRSLAIVRGGELCALADAGVVCIGQGATAATDVRSTWPDRSAPLWFADLDGDQRVDWCSATPAGPACSLGAHRELTTDGVPWGFATAGQIEGSASDGAVPDAATAVFTDIDGDGRDDLCTLRGEVIACARSTGRGFAPRGAIARLPAGMAATALWAEPAEPGQPPRLCAADAQTIACTD
jgi:LmbE family N-acetylglucosaminyl deacetylase